MTKASVVKMERGLTLEEGDHRGIGEGRPTINRLEAAGEGAPRTVDGGRRC